MLTANFRLRANTFMWAITALGGLVCVGSVLSLPFDRLDAHFLLLAVLTIAVGSRCSVQIPRVKSHISVSDTFIFLTLMLYGGEAAVVVAALDGLSTSLRFTRKPGTLCFNSAVVALSTFVTASTLSLAFGDFTALTLHNYTPAFVLAVVVMACVQYASNSWLVAIAGSLRGGRPVWQNWRQNYLWTSITYIAGASAAGVIAKLIGLIGFYAFFGTLPVVGIVYFTYLTYMKQVQASAAQAAQARQHVEELSHYIAEQERLREQFSQLEKMSALGELASGVAHDFNNTLAGVLGRAQLLTRTSDPEKISRGLRIIIKTAEDGAKTVKRIQDFARQRRDYELAPVRVDQLLLDVREMTRPRWEDQAGADGRCVSVALRLHSAACVMGDESELREVLVNMVFNALDAMPGGGTLTLSTGEAAGGQVFVRVEDTGTGMPPEVRARVFDPFFTTKGRAGMGLGLAVSYGIIHRHSGTVEVESEPGRGTAFTITMPATSAVPQESQRESEPAFSSARGEAGAAAVRLLVVDDEAHVRELLREILEAEGCEVATAGGGAEALTMLDANRFDGVFTDIGMPGMSGWELARAVRERDLRMPLAVVTGWGEAVGSDEQQAARVDWVVTKPFTLERVSQIVRDIAERRDALSAAA